MPHIKFKIIITVVFSTSLLAASVFAANPFFYTQNGVMNIENEAVYFNGDLNINNPISAPRIFTTEDITINFNKASGASIKTFKIDNPDYSEELSVDSNGILKFKNDHGEVSLDKSEINPEFKITSSGGFKILDKTGGEKSLYLYDNNGKIFIGNNSPVIGLDFNNSEVNFNPDFALGLNFNSDVGAEIGGILNFNGTTFSSNSDTLTVNKSLDFKNIFLDTTDDGNANSNRAAIKKWIVDHIFTESEKVTAEEWVPGETISWLNVINTQPLDNNKFRAHRHEVQVKVFAGAANQSGMNCSDSLDGVWSVKFDNSYVTSFVSNSNNLEVDFSNFNPKYKNGTAWSAYEITQNLIDLGTTADARRSSPRCTMAVYCPDGWSLMFARADADNGEGVGGFYNDKFDGIRHQSISTADTRQTINKNSSPFSYDIIGDTLDTSFALMCARLTSGVIEQDDNTNW